MKQSVVPSYVAASTKAEAARLRTELARLDGIIAAAEEAWWETHLSTFDVGEPATLNGLLAEREAAPVALQERMEGRYPAFLFDTALRTYQCSAADDPETRNFFDVQFSPRAWAMTPAELERQVVDLFTLVPAGILDAFAIRHVCADGDYYSLTVTSYTGVYTLWQGDNLRIRSHDELSEVLRTLTKVVLEG